MEHLNSHMEQQSIQWRRDKVQELNSQGKSQREIAKILQVGIGTVNRDLSFLRQQAKENIRRYVNERLPEEYEKCLVGLTAILREAWNTSRQTEDRREKIQALSLAKDCYSMKLDLLTNATVVDDAIRFVSEKGAANVEPKTDAAPVIIEEKKHQQEQENNKGEQESDNNTTKTINQVFLKEEET